MEPLGALPGVQLRNNRAQGAAVVEGDGVALERVRQQAAVGQKVAKGQIGRVAAVAVKHHMGRLGPDV